MEERIPKLELGCKKGFTLIELILVAGVLAVIGLAVYGTFVNGVNIWQRVTEESVTEELGLFFEKVSYDLRNTFKLTDMRFRGERDKISFPARINAVDNDDIVKSIGEVSYFYDRRKKTLNRQESSYSEVYRKKPGKKRVLTEDVNSLKFQYYVYNEKEKKYSWENHWQDRDNAFGIVVEEQLPLIVRIEVGLKGDKLDKKYVKTILIPSGCCWPLEDELN